MKHEICSNKIVKKSLKYVPSYGFIYIYLCIKGWMNQTEVDEKHCFEQIWNA